MFVEVVEQPFVRRKEAPRKIPRFDIAMIILAAFLNLVVFRYLYQWVDSRWYQDIIYDFIRIVFVFGCYSVLRVALFRYT